MVRGRHAAAPDRRSAFRKASGLGTLLVTMLLLTALVPNTEAQAEAADPVPSGSISPFVWEPRPTGSGPPRWVPGQPTGYTEGETAAMAAVILGEGGNTYSADVCIQVQDPSGTTEYAFLAFRPWDETYRPPHLPPSTPGPGPGVDYTDGSWDRTNPLVWGRNLTVNSVSAASRAQGRCESDYLGLTIIFTVAPNEEPAFLVWGGLLAYPGGPIPEAFRPPAAVPDGQSASDVNGTFQSRLAGAGDKTINFKGDLIAPFPTLSVVKTADPTSLPEPGGPVTFHVRVTNSGTGDATLTSLLDDVYGDITQTGHHGITSTNCATGVDVVAGTGTYECRFTAPVLGEPGTYTDTVTVTESGGDTAQASASVLVTDVLPTATLEKTAIPTLVAEPGGLVSFSLEVRNTGSVEELELVALRDSVHGDLNGKGTCRVGGFIDPGDTYACTFTASVGGPAGYVETDRITATLRDDEGNEVSPDDDATVTISDVGFTVGVTKDASPGSVSEPGGVVTFAVQVVNFSSVQNLTITSLSDDVFGDLDRDTTAAHGWLTSTCDVPADLSAGSDTYSCSFTARVAGSPGTQHTDEVTAAVTDGDSQPVEVKDRATVSVTDVAGRIEVDKSASPDTLVEPGGSVVFTITVRNMSAVDAVTITSLVDSIHGDPTALEGSTCRLPQTLKPAGTVGDTYTCTFGAQVRKTETDRVTVLGADDDGREVGAFDEATVTVSARIEVLPQVVTTATTTSTTTSTTGPEVLPFTGGPGGTAAGVAVALTALGGLVLLVVRRREEAAVIVAGDWYPRMRHYDLKYWDA